MNLHEFRRHRDIDHNGKVVDLRPDEWSRPQTVEPLDLSSFRFASRASIDLVAMALVVCTICAIAALVTH